ncbi:MAG: EamA/RhaT family transporter, partial [Clostridium sp.]|nr:EamA/RhaT family transporter [Clostridium sp.]
LLYLAFISAAAYTLWRLLLKHNPVLRVAVYGFMNQVLGVILSAWLLAENDQAFGVKTVIALLLVCLGIYVVNRPRIAKKAEV